MATGFDGIYGLHQGFLQSVDRHSGRPALEVQGAQYSYSDLYHQAAAVGAALQSAMPETTAPLVGVLANRSLPVYSGLLGTLMAGKAVVPLNPGFPQERTQQMVEQAGLQALVADGQGEALLSDLLPGMDVPMVVVLPLAESAQALQARFPQHRFLTRAELGAPSDWRPASVQPDDLAYLFFTSGSTGTPKGVGVLHRNALRFVAMSLERYRPFGISEADRFSQFYDITFDSSMFDLYVSWAFGACLCCPTAKEWFNPNKYIEEGRLSVIDITPSAGHGMNRRDGWRPGRFQALRLCRFGGEALSAELATAMAAAAPHARVDNAYGPTECTVDSAYYLWDPERSPGECEHGMVPIGYPGNQVQLTVVDDDLQPVPEGAEGELLIGGPQVTPGYWNDPERTEQAFIRLPSDGAVHYRTGDLVRRPPAGKPIMFLGRMDHQIKVGGVRIELGEVEQALREAAATDEAVALGWPRTSSGAAGIVGFVVAGTADEAAIRDQLRSRLPSVMVPRVIHALEALPLNPNGKVDRKALMARLEAEAGGR
ncbi:amino acid adenylation domain-containing protein [Alkalilimnicola ehrlichii MLHE-1]|uniref:Amino acid adenylation domain protein n=1 Tax=Alkalilimnicola ehrlichii (strain ATCC BAA-1101 / DSM 17681 / MLHE-1) TaxID=187272 RepID=Q0ACF1_ALKEH|nr:amino acid adenylation domain-containing protein [Alkalilimnicola ehrlichii]ABI55486.1 amino acid adenylation domain protein [Alkalilimnicola ehrlichii MLHE-1]